MKGESQLQLRETIECLNPPVRNYTKKITTHMTHNMVDDHPCNKRHILKQNKFFIKSPQIIWEKTHAKGYCLNNNAAIVKYCQTTLETFNKFDGLDKQILCSRKIILQRTNPSTIKSLLSHLSNYNSRQTTSSNLHTYDAIKATNKH